MDPNIGNFNGNPIMTFSNANYIYDHDDSYGLSDNFLDDFSRMNLSTYRDNNGSFLGGVNNIVNSNNNHRQHVLDSRPVVLDSPVAAADIQRMRLESAIRGQPQMQRCMYLQGSNGNICSDPLYCVNCSGSGSGSGYMYNDHVSGNTNGIQVPQYEYVSDQDYVSNMYRRDNGRFDMYNYLISNNSGSNIVSASNNLESVVGSNNNSLSNHRLSTRQREQTLRYTRVEEVRGSIYRLAKDQIGSKFLGEEIAKGKTEDIEMIFEEVKDHVPDLMVDQFGNFLVQKLLQFCNDDQFNMMFMSVVGDARKLLSICIDMHGTRALQKMVDNVKTAYQMSSFASVMKHVTLNAIKNANGHHVIGSCLKFFDQNYVKPILDVVADNCIDISMDKSGCCAIPVCILYGNVMYKRRLADEITANALNLSGHSYGNYVVQYVVGLKSPQYTAEIIKQLKGNFVDLSMNKYGSNVVEKCINVATEDQLSDIIHELVYSKDFLHLLQDQFGNYVAQSALGAAKDTLRNMLVQAVQEHYPFIHSHPHGKRVLSRVKALTKHHHA